jgi:biopolymer transport protein ExbD
MNPRKFIQLMLQAQAGAVTGLFLILGLCAAVFSISGAHGVSLLLPSAPLSSDCGDSRDVVIHWKDDGSVWLNEENVGAVRAPARVAEIMQNRAERVVFLIPGKGESVQDVASLAARLNNSVDDLHIGLVTNRQIEEMTRTDHGITWDPIGCMGFPRSAFQSRGN